MNETLDDVAALIAHADGHPRFVILDAAYRPFLIRRIVYAGEQQTVAVTFEQEAEGADPQLYASPLEEPLTGALLPEYPVSVMANR